MRTAQIVSLGLAGIVGLALPAGSLAVTRYVDLNSGNPTAPFTDWTTAAANIQDAIDASGPGDQILVTNGVYQTGGRSVSGVSTTNRVAVTQLVTVQSVNGPDVTSIVGYQPPGMTNGPDAVRCVYLTNGASLVGFTLTNGGTGATTDDGGGVWFRSLTPTASVVSNCVLAGNAAGEGGAGAYGGDIGASPAVALKLIHCTLENNWARGYGGAAYGCVLVDCLEAGNSAGNSGGGSCQCLLTNCVVVGNSAGFSGGGSYGDKLVNCTIVSNSIPGTNLGLSGGGIGNGLLVANCIVYFNSAPTGANYYDAPMAYCCTTPAIAGAGNLTNAPLLVAPANGDYHLLSNSPCINSGDNAYISASSDFDGSARIAGGTVDIGAYEFQSPSSLLSYAWAQQYGFATDGSADFIDSDGDGMNNWQEWRAGTDPTDPLSVLKMFAPSNNAPGLKLGWESVAGKRYYLLRGTDLAAPTALTLLQTNIVGQAGATGFADTTATNAGPYFYRVGVQ